MELKKIKTQTSLLVEINGRIDTNTAMEFGMEIDDELDEVKELILDFANVEYVSSLGLRAILELQKKMAGQMKIINVNQSVMSVFTMTGFNKIINIQNA